MIQVDPETDRVLRTIPIGTAPTGVAAGDGGVWAASNASDVLWDVDPVSGDVSTVPAFRFALSVGATKHRVYAVFDSHDGLERFPPEPNPPVKAVLENSHGGPLGDPTQVATGPSGDVWGLAGDTVYRVVPSSVFQDHVLDLVTFRYTDNEERGMRGLSGLAVGRHTAWVIGDVGDRRLWRVDIGNRPHYQESRILGSPLRTLLSASGMYG